MIAVKGGKKASQFLKTGFADDKKGGNAYFLKKFIRRARKNYFLV